MLGAGFSRGVTCCILSLSLQDAAICTPVESSLKTLLSVEATTSTQHFSCAPKSMNGTHQKVFPQNPRGIFAILRFIGTMLNKTHSM